MRMRAMGVVGFLLVGFNFPGQLCLASSDRQAELLPAETDPVEVYRAEKEEAFTLLSDGFSQTAAKINRAQANRLQSLLRTSTSTGELSVSDTRDLLNTRKTLVVALGEEKEQRVERLLSSLNDQEPCVVARAAGELDKIAQLLRADTESHTRMNEILANNIDQLRSKEDEGERLTPEEKQRLVGYRNALAVAIGPYQASLVEESQRKFGVVRRALSPL